MWGNGGTPAAGGACAGSHHCARGSPLPASLSRKPLLREHVGRVRDGKVCRARATHPGEAAAPWSVATPDA